LKTSQGQRSRSSGEGHRNLVNAIAPEPLKGFEPKLIQIFPIVGPRTDQVFKVTGSKVEVTDKIFLVKLKTAAAYSWTVRRQLSSSYFRNQHDI